MFDKIKDVSEASVYSNFVIYIENNLYQIQIEASQNFLHCITLTLSKT